MSQLLGGRRKEAVKEFAERWRIKETYFGDDFIERLCADPEVEVVDIGLPNFLHNKATMLAAENGKHVICEKPLAHNVNEDRSILFVSQLPQKLKRTVGYRAHWS